MENKSFQKEDGSKKKRFFFMKKTGEGVNVSRSDSRFVLLRPHSVPKEDLAYQVTRDPIKIYQWLESVTLEDEQDAVAFDTETNGTKVFGNDRFKIVGIGFCHGTDSIYLSLKGRKEKDISSILRRIHTIAWRRDLSLIAHNLFFDASVVSRYLGTPRPTKGRFEYAPGWLPYKFCTYSLFRFLAGEGFPEQSWSLKYAQTELLLWDDRGDEEIVDWLLNNGYITTKKASVHYKKTKEENEECLRKIREGLAQGKEYHANKAKMYLVPDEILGKYCCLDVYSTYMFYRKVLLPSINIYTTDRFTWFQSIPWMTLIRNCVEAYRDGIEINKQMLIEYSELLHQNIRNVTQNIYRVYKKQIDAHNNERIREWRFTGKRYKDVKTHTEPKKRTASGKLSKSWIKWRLASKRQPQEITSAYAKHRLEKRRVLKAYREWGILPYGEESKLLKDFMINLNSTDDKRRLLYDGVQYEETQPYKDERRPGCIRFLHNEVEIEYTKSGALPTGKAAIMAIAGVTSPLNAYNREVKKIQFTESTISKIRNGRLHIAMNIPGTLTCRLSGSGGLNLQNIVKDPGFLRAWGPSNPHAKLLISLDFCLKGGTEILTKSGWKEITTVTEDDQVFQVNKDSLQGSWCTPLRTIKYEYSGKMYSFGNIRGKLDVTPNHTMLFVGQHHATRKDKHKRRWIIKSDEKIPSTGMHLLLGSETELNALQSYWTEMEMMMACMSQADASNPYGDYYTIEVSLPKKRAKVAELLQCEGKVKARVQNGKAKLDTEWWSYHLKHPLLEGKNICVDNIGANQADLFRRCLQFWDGSSDHGDTTKWFSTNKPLVDKVQSYFVRCGYEAKLKCIYEGSSAHKKCYELAIRPGNRVRVRPIDVNEYNYTGMVGCVTVPEGFILVRSEGQTFITGNCALEPTTLTECSRDKSMLMLYGPDAKKGHDVYSFTAAMCKGKMGQVFVDEGYDVDNPDPEKIAHVKKKLKSLRNLWKLVVLSDDYGSGVPKKHRTARLFGFDICIEEMQDIQDRLNQAYQGKKVFGALLAKEHEQNGGFVLDAFGFPTAVYHKKTKDITNRVIQKSGHMSLVLQIYYLTKAFIENEIRYKYYVVDYHDETDLVVDVADVDRAKEIVKDMLSMLNKDILKAYIPLKMEPQVAASMAEVKCENEKYHGDEEIEELLEELNA